ncbi:MAG: hypothetical protein BMS9Abin36_1803 [Gammaproteobacteria bacterium]|nr:MAG: hypothetical protein BMS9Abin36_1803 [Gammaproteobacteria bacterium]
MVSVVIHPWRVGVLYGAMHKEQRYYSAAVFLLSSVVLAVITIWLLQHHYISDFALSRWAKVLGILDAPESRLEYFGLIYPHIPAYILMPFYFLPGLKTGAAPYLISIIIGAALLAFWNQHMANKGYSTRVRVALIILVASHPFFLWSVTGGTYRALSLAMFYILYLSLARLIYERDVRAFIMLGLTLAMYFFIDERTFYLFAALLPLLPLVAPPKMMEESAISVYVVVIIPLFIAVSAWAYLNWIFVDDSLHFLTAPESAFRGAWRDAPYLPWLNTFGGTLVMPTILAIAVSIVAYPVLIVLLVHASRHALLLRATIVLLVHAILATGMATYGFFLSHPADMLFLFSSGLMAGIVLMPRESHKAIRITMVMTLVSVLGGWLVFLWKPTPEMDQWATAIQGKPPVIRYDNEIDLGVWLARNRMPTLIDDHNAYRVIVARGDARQLILPFSSDFKINLLRPVLSIRQVVVPDPSWRGGARDLINKRYPDLYQNGMAGFELVYDQDHWRAYRRINDTSVKDDVARPSI